MHHFRIDRITGFSVDIKISFIRASSEIIIEKLILYKLLVMFVFANVLYVFMSFEAMRQETEKD